jgi:hypothetical protein
MKQGVHWMSDHLVYLARTSRFGERNASRKLAMIALCNAASDKGEAIEMGAAEIAEAAELADVKSAMRVRRELVNLGLVEIVDGVGEKPLPGQGRGAKGIYKVNVARLKALHEGDWDYLAEARKLRTEKGSVTPPKEADTCDAEMPSVKGGGMGVSKGVAMGVSKGVSASTSSIKDSTNYWIDDVPDLQLPGWSVEAVKQLEPERWAVLAEAYLRWPKARKAVDIGNAFIGWAKSTTHLLCPPARARRAPDEGGATVDRRSPPAESPCRQGRNGSGRDAGTACASGSSCQGHALRGHYHEDPYFGGTSEGGAAGWCEKPRSSRTGNSPACR